MAFLGLKEMHLGCPICPLKLVTCFALLVDQIDIVESCKPWITYWESLENTGLASDLII